MGERHHHLVFAREELQNPRRRRDGRSPGPPEDVEGHARRLAQELDTVVREGQPREPGFDPRLLLKIEAKGVVPDDFEAIPGLSLVAEQDGHFLVLFAEDEALRDFRSRLNQLQSGGVPSRKELLYATQSFGALTRDDRTGAALGAFGLPDNESAVVDVELWPIPKFREMVQAFRQWCVKAELSIVDSVERPNLVLLRVHGSKSAIDRMLDHRDVRLVDLPPTFRLERQELEVTGANTAVPERPPEDAPVIGVIDSGIAENHPLLAPAVADAQSYLDGRGASDEVGHGTAVAGLALYGDIHDCAQRGQFVVQFHIASARVLDDKNMTDTKLIQNQIAKAVAEFSEQYHCKIFNVSIGDANKPYVGGHVRGLAAELDRLARDYGVLFVVSAGNYDGFSPFREPVPDWRRDYPGYLLEMRSARICDPAPAMNAITVGSLARFEASHQAQRHPNDPAYQCVARRFEPSPFSRGGPGPNGCIKPELVDFGGNSAVDVRDDPHRCSHLMLGEPSLEMDFLARGRWLSEFSGTSFAAPKVAHFAGLLLRDYGDASANLLRALLVAHASAPVFELGTVRPELANPKKSLGHWGYGRVDKEPLVYSTEHCVSLLAESTIAADSHHFYELPLPDDFLEPGRRVRRITIGLSHMPPTRTTRIEYRAARIAFRLVRAEHLEAVSRVFVKTTKKDRLKNIAEFRTGFPSADSRDRGSVQSARYDVSQLPKPSMPLRLFVVVTHSVNPWGAALVQDSEPYALVVRVEEQGRESVRYFTQMQAKLRARAKVRGRARV